MVAGEVRELAQGTARATDDITNGYQAAIAEAVLLGHSVTIDELDRREFGAVSNPRPVAMGRRVHGQ